MSAENKNPSFRILMLIAHSKLTEKAMKLFEKSNLPVHMQFFAQGTASSDMLDILGLGGIEKDVLFTIVPKSVADNMLRTIYLDLELSQKNSGIVFTLPLSGINSMFMKMNEQLLSDNTNITPKEVSNNMNEGKYSLITATVNQGFCEDVMNAARAAGARGGTYFHTNSMISKDAKENRGADFQEERETIMIIASNDTKLEIMRAISHNCGINTKAQGIVTSLPIDSILGLYEG